MAEIMTYEFDYCYFCAKDDYYSSDCKVCLERKHNTPTEFVEKDSVKAYRKAMTKHNGACWGCECKEVKKDG